MTNYDNYWAWELPCKIYSTAKTCNGVKIHFWDWRCWSTDKLSNSQILVAGHLLFLGWRLTGSCTTIKVDICMHAWSIMQWNITKDDLTFPASPFKSILLLACRVQSNTTKDNLTFATSLFKWLRWRECNHWLAHCWALSHCQRRADIIISKTQWMTSGFKPI